MHVMRDVLAGVFRTGPLPTGHWLAPPRATTDKPSAAANNKLPAALTDRSSTRTHLRCTLAWCGHPLCHYEAATGEVAAAAMTVRTVAEQQQNRPTTRSSPVSTTPG